MKCLYTALLAVSLLVAPAAQAMQTPINLDIPVRVVSVGVALLGIKTMFGSSSTKSTESTKFRSALRISVGAALTVGGLIGAMYGQNLFDGTFTNDIADGMSKGADFVHDAACKLYYGVKRKYTGDLQDHAAYYYYAAKHKLNCHIITR